MLIRIWSTMSYIDIEVDDTFNKEELIASIDRGDTIYLKTKEGNEIFLNNINVLAIELIKSPLISKKDAL